MMSKHTVRNVTVGILGTVSCIIPFSMVYAATSTGAPLPGKAQPQLTGQQLKVAQTKQKKADAYYKNHFLTSKKSTSSALSPQSAYTTYDSLGVQTTIENPDDNCGPAATFQDAAWKNSGNHYFQSSSDNPNNYPAQYNLRTLEKTQSPQGTYAVNIPGPLNQASNTGSYYTASNANSESSMLSDITYDVNNNYPLVADVSTSYLDYYNGASYAHYISVDGYSSYYSNGNFVDNPQSHVVDDNWHTQYSGQHWTSSSGLYNAIAAYNPNPNLIW